MAAEPNSDHQLALVRAYARAARSEPAIGFLAGLLSGDTVLPGLTVDTDLRWTLLAALARSGRVGPDQVDAELSRDDTISGRENAAAVLAMMPNAEAKRRAWEDAVVRDDVPNETQRGIAAAFYQPGQEEVLAEYRDKYLEIASTAWERLGVQRATVVLSYLFPRIPPSTETLDVVDRWLASEQADGAARRYVAEGRAEMARQLTAQARDETQDRDPR
jgi:aminopeptidase N